MLALPRRLRDAPGFTLVELLIGLAIIAIMTAFAVPFTSSYRTKENARNFADQVRIALQAAREHAITSGQPTWIAFDDPANPIGVPAAFGQGVFAVIARDVDFDNDFNIDNDSDFSQPFALERNVLAAGVSPYGLNPLANLGVANPPYPTAALPAQDVRGISIPIPDLQTLVGGTSLPPIGLGNTNNLQGVAFTPQGIPVAIQPGPLPPLGAPGSGAPNSSDRSIFMLPPTSALPAMVGVLCCGKMIAFSGQTRLQAGQPCRQLSGCSTRIVS